MELDDEDDGRVRNRALIIGTVEEIKAGAGVVVEEPEEASRVKGTGTDCMKSKESME